MNFYEFFSALPRHEPGGATFTSGYLSAVNIKASDVACELATGPGTTAVWIARSRGCRVVAVDKDRRWLEMTQLHAREGGADDLVDPVCADYRSLPFGDNAFRVVLAEGAALGLGLKQALTLWRRLISPKGHLTLTYPGVVNKNAPPEVRGPLERRMVEPLGTLADYESVIRATSYELIHQSTLPNELWDGYYNDVVRHVWALEKAGKVTREDPFIRGVLEEARWFRHIGRGRVFLLGLVLRRVR